jgi:hypothetical protein
VDRLNRKVPVDSPNWDMSKQLIALDARKNAMTAYTDDLFLGAQEAHQALWPRQKTPTDPLDLGNDLQLSKVHIREWRDSGARVGADEALTYFLSWYEKVDLETALCARRICMDHRSRVYPTSLGVGPQLCGLCQHRGLCPGHPRAREEG